jgi:MFS family permease
MTTSAPPTNQLATRIAAVAVTLMFVVNGTVIGGYGGSLPSLRDKLGIDATHIAIMLFCAGAAAILAMQVGGRLADALGAREITLATIPLLIVGMITIGLAPSFAIAIIGVVLIGLGNGAMDVAMNAIGVQVEASRQRPIMSFFHAFWSIGTFVGAGAVLLLATVLGLHGAAIVTPVSILIAVVTLIALGILLKITPEAAVVHHTVDGVKTPIPKVTWILGVMALAFGLSEGTATDWSSLHVTDVAGVDPTTGALGLITVSAFMVIIRLLGDRLVTRFGRRAVVRFGALFAALGYLTVTLVSSLPMLVFGWALVGFGVGMIAPPVYAVAGHIGGGRMLAVVVTFGYAAFLIGPAVVGFLVNRFGIHHAMAVPALLCAGIIGLASTMPRDDVGITTTVNASQG